MFDCCCFQAGLLVAETEFALQVESDIAPYKGLLMGLFFMTVGMEISVGLFFAEWKTVVGGIVLLVAGKVRTTSKAKCDTDNTQQRMSMSNLNACAFLTCGLSYHSLGAH